MTCLAVLCAGLLLSSERRRRESARMSAQFRAIVEALPDCLNVKDREGRFIAANSATARLMGARSAEALIGRTEFDFLSCRDRRALPGGRREGLEVRQHDDARAIDRRRFSRTSR